MPLLTCAQLAAVIPDFEWDKGHSGLVLNDFQTSTLSKLWLAYNEQNKKDFLRKTLAGRDYIFMARGLEDIALEIATKAHAGQLDKAGKEYIEHPRRVADNCDTDEERIVALLHDTIEDSDITPEYLLEAGFPEHIVEAVISVTKREEETYEDYIKRAARNPIGCRVKRYDLQDNMDVSRLSSLGEEDIERLNRYIRAYCYLNAVANV